MNEKKPYNSVLQYFENHPLHQDIELTDLGILRIRDHAARSDECSFKEIDFNKFWLPTNSVYNQKKYLFEVPSFVILILEALNTAAIGSGATKSKSKRLAMTLKTNVKFVEFLWLNDVYCIDHIPQELLDELPKLLASGGWHLALNIDERLMEFLDTADNRHHQLFDYTNSSFTVNGAGFQETLGTNLAGKEVAEYFNIIKEFQIKKGWLSRNDYVAKHNQPKDNLGMKFSMLKSTLEGINQSFHSREGNIKAPYPDYIRLSKKLTDSPGHTLHLDSHYAGNLLEACLTFLYENAEVILKVLLFSATEMKKHHTYTNAERRNFFRTVSLKAKELGLDYRIRQIFGIDNLKSLQRLNDLTRAIHSACFIVIAVFNARRKDEITHKKFGVH